jgi:hypothetical protein
MTLSPFLRGKLFQNKTIALYKIAKCVLPIKDFNVIRFAVNNTTGKISICDANEEEIKV